MLDLNASAVTKGSGYGCLDHHGAGDVGERQAYLAWAYPDDRFQRFQQLGGDGADPQPNW